MDARFLDSLLRQMKGFELLKSLLEEEYVLLRGNDPQLVAQVEFSIQELVQQLSHERKLVIKGLKGRKIKQYLAALPNSPKANELAALVTERVAGIDAMEQACARQARKNKKLVLALMDQSQEVVDYLYAQLVPKPKAAYSSQGRYANRRPEAALLQGRL